LQSPNKNKYYLEKLGKEILNFREHKSGMTASEILSWIQLKENELLRIQDLDKEGLFRVKELTLFLSELRQKLTKFSELELDYDYKKNRKLL
jgi:hypothetical protein